MIAASAQPAAAHTPAEVRGHGRDDVRLLIAHRDGGQLLHAGFSELPELLEPGDLLVINTSATMPAALPVRGGDGDLRMHLSAPLPGRPAWLVELRRGDERFEGGAEGDVFLLPGGATAVLLGRHTGGRLWLAALHLPATVPHYLARHGQACRACP